MIHLHVHTDGSGLDGACKPSRLVKRAVELNMDAVGITDHGNMIKAFEMQQECVKAGIKPIIGCEFYVGDEDSDDVFHLVCIAKNNTGLRNLYILNAYAYTENFYRKPRITWEQLCQHKEGLIITTACLGSEFAEFYKKRDFNGLETMLDWCKCVFGDDFYVEIQTNVIPLQKEYNRKMIDLANQLNIQVIVSSDVHYVYREDFNAHDTMLCMQVQKKKNDADRFRFSCNDFYLKSQAEIAEELLSLGVNINEAGNAIANTHRLAAKCDARIEVGRDFMPHITVPSSEPKILAEHCNIGFKKRYDEGHYEGLNIQDVIDRIMYELKIIKEKGYCGYFLIVEDYIRFANERGILTGSRGSACGSEVAFVLGITEIEPISNGLLFERFLNPERNSPPDIDLDFDYLRRHEVIEYIKEKYGSKHVAHIIAEGTLTVKAVCRKVLSVYDYEQKVINHIAKQIPDNIDSIKQCMECIPEFTFAMRGKEKEYADMLVLEGLMSHTSTHAAGIAVANQPIANIVPCMSNGDNRDMLVTQWHKKILEAVGVYKFDILGLKTLTCLNIASKLVKNNKGVDITLDSIDIYDEKLFKFLSEGHLSGIN